jgi:hypothetical protein
MRTKKTVKFSSYRQKLEKVEQRQMLLNVLCRALIVLADIVLRYLRHP